MTLDQVRKLRPGDEVTWNDPDGGLCSRTGKLLAINVPPMEPDQEEEDDLTIIHMTFEDGGEVEAFAEELS